MERQKVTAIGRMLIACMAVMMGILLNVWVILMFLKRTSFDMGCFINNMIALQEHLITANRGIDYYAVLICDIVLVYILRKTRSRHEVDGDKGVRKQVKWNWLVNAAYAALLIQVVLVMLADLLI